MNWTIVEGLPIWQQLNQQLMKLISTGFYEKGSRLPSVRELAAEAGVNPNTMQRALTQLEADGLVSTQRTAGRTVTQDEGVIQSVRVRLAQEQITSYLKNMALLGFSKEESIALLEKSEVL